MSGLSDFLNRAILGNSVRDYLVSLGIVVATLLVALLIDRYLRKSFFAWAEKTKTTLDDFVVNRLFPPVIYLLIVIGLYFAKSTLEFHADISMWLDRILFAIGLAVFFLLIIRFARGFIELAANSYLQRLAKAEPDNLEEQKRSVERIKKQVSEIANMALGIMAILTILSNLGVNLKAIWASLGIGGIALALAVKEPLTNLVGRMYIYGTGIFDEGHFIVYGQWSGTVKRITVFRTYVEVFSDMSTVSIPNGDFVKGAVQNYYTRTKFMYKWDLDVPYDVSHTRIQELLVRLRELVNGKPEVNRDSCWIYLQRLDRYSKVVRVWFQAVVPTWADSLHYGSRMLQDIQALFESMDIEFAFPTQTLHVQTSNPPHGPVIHQPEEADSEEK